MERLRAFVDENIGHKVAADLEVRIGQPAEEIVAAARESKCDSIMLSTRGLTGLDRFLMGSVADRVAQFAPCRVILLRPAKRAPGREQKPRTVLRFKRKTKAQR
jgi:nucleotide-binding universal stress UspA family protein